MSNPTSSPLARALLVLIFLLCLGQTAADPAGTYPQGSARPLLEADLEGKSAQELLRALIDTTVKEFAAMHPRLAAQELDQYQAGIKPLRAPDHKAPDGPGPGTGIGAAGIVKIPTQGKLGEGFAIPSTASSPPAPST